ncbi:5'-deoxynucleotidase [Aestuariirhabdus sp. LZHN29]|uniref:5'-deoxynucleotidase n=1 Tax=Aestuariirhabdus sp. LZHN29 TaxID=3417462 RepID=UPI003CF4AB9D
MSESSEFLTRIRKLKWINRWGLSKNLVSENVMEHSWEVAVIAHLLGLLARRNGEAVDPAQLALAGIYHDATESLTGDLPTPVKYHSPQLQQAYKALEHEAVEMLSADLAPDLGEEIRALLSGEHLSEKEAQLLKAADMVAAYLKAEEERDAGNIGYIKPLGYLRERMDKLNCPEVEQLFAEFINVEIKSEGPIRE